MNKRIIYQNDENGVSIIIPAPGFTAEDCIANVPSGSPYLIVEDDAIPADRTFREAWTADFSNAEVAE